MVVKIQLLLHVQLLIKKLFGKVVPYSLKIQQIDMKFNTENEFLNEKWILLSLSPSTNISIFGKVFLMYYVEKGKNYKQ